VVDDGEYTTRSDVFSFTIIENNNPPVKLANPFPKNGEVIVFPSLEDVDLNGDGEVNILDLNLVANHLGEIVDPRGSEPYDINKDGYCDYSDLNYVILFMSNEISLFIQVFDRDDNNMDVSFYWDMMGDIDDDGVITETDAHMIGQYVIGNIDFTEEQIFRADVSNHNGITLFDATLVGQYANGIIDSFPASLIGNDTDVSSEDVAYISTEELPIDADYGWYAVADDGEDTTKSDVFSFTIKDGNNPPNEPCNPSPYDGEILVKITEKQADTNGDGTVSLADCTFIGLHLGEIVSPPGSEPYDVNADGIVTMSDISLVQMFYFNTEVIILAVDVFDLDNDTMDVSFYWDMLGDINDNGEVADIVDLTMIAYYVGDNPEHDFADWQIFRMDLDGDGDVDEDDLHLMGLASVGDMDVFPGSLIGIKEDVPSGEIAFINTDDLELDFGYRWYAVADDGENTAKSDVFSFTIKEMEQPPELDIEIQDGTGRINAVIHNIGETNALNVEWTIKADGFGLIGLRFENIDISVDGVIDEISAEESKKIDSGEGSIDYKIGIIDIEVTAKVLQSNNANPVSVTAKALGLILKDQVYILRAL
jgi:hypothetical protein